MRTKVNVGEPVELFIRSLAPEPRRAVRQGLKGLGHDKGDVKYLEGRLAGFFRLRVGNVRVIFKTDAMRGGRVIFCIYANYRNVVYELFQQLVASGLLEQMTES